MLLLTLALFALTPPLAASAHAGLVSTDPVAGAVLETAPTNAHLVFTETVTPVADGFALWSPAGERLTVTASATDATVRVALPGPLPEGSYTLAWRVISADSHPISGTIPFAIGAESPASAPVPDAEEPTAARLLALAQGVGSAGLLGAAGILAFRLLVLHAPGAPSRAERRARRGLSLAAIGGMTAAIPLTLARQQPTGLAALADPSAWVTGFPLAESLQAALVAAGLLGGAALRIRGHRTPALLATALAVLAPLATGHSRSIGPAWLVLGTNAGHLLAGAVWFGGLLGLALTLRETPDSERAALVRRFSTLAAGAASLVLITGIALGLVITEGGTRLLDTGYGRTLLVKLGLVLVAVVLAAGNRVILRGRTVGAETVRRVLRRETAVLAAALAVTGLLITLSPHDAGHEHHETTAALSIEENLDLGPVQAELHLTPLTAGRYAVTLDLRTGDAPAEPASPPSLALSLPAENLGPIRAEVTAVAEPGRYTGEVLLPTPGTWSIDLAVRLDAFTEPVVRIERPLG